MGIPVVGRWVSPYIHPEVLVTILPLGIYPTLLPWVHHPPALLPLMYAHPLRSPVSDALGSDRE